MKKSISRFKKHILAMSIAGFCLISALCVTVGAISFYNNSKLTIYYHYIPILNDSAVGIPGCPSGTYDYNTLYTYTTVTAYNGSDSVTAKRSCYEPVYVLEGWSKYTQAEAKIRSIQSATAKFTIGSKTGGTATQYASVDRP